MKPTRKHHAHVPMSRQFFHTLLSVTRRYILLQGFARCLPWRELPEKIGWGVRPSSQNPYPIYDQNLRFSLPIMFQTCLIIISPFQTNVKGNELSAFIAGII